MKNFAMLILLLSFVTTNAFALAPNQSDDVALKLELFKKTTSGHHAVGYDTAKKYLFQQLYLEKDEKGYFVIDLYCGTRFSNVGPASLPDQNRLNTEHTWPQSKFSGHSNKGTQKSDLHHLFPTDSKANSTRGNYDFAEVTKNENLSNCSLSKSGPSVISGGKNFFEPPVAHKGNVARALFYFSVRYKIEIPDEEEDFLRRWNHLDPVDEQEMARNNAIEKIQGNRNPFIDQPELADSITNF
jgi:deoxyribonuclease-1